MSYANAFNCKDCPQTGTEKGCPLWWELMTVTPQGESDIEKNCGLVTLPVLMVEVIKASNRPAAAVESMRNELATSLVGGFNKLAQLAQQTTITKD